MKIALIRHPAPLIVPGICYGRLDIPLHPSAAEDIARLSAHPELRGMSCVWTSPARRCRAVADPIAQAAGITMALDERLLELDFGEWEGSPWDSVDRACLDRWSASPLAFAPPGGESGKEIIARVRDFHDQLQRNQLDCVVVSHGGPLKILRALLEGRAIDLLQAAPPLGSLRTVTCQP